MKKNIYVVGAVIVKNGKIFCAQRGRDKSLAEMWEFPGGKIEEGETPEEALKREILEEMKCEIEVGKKLEHTVYEYDFGIVHLTTYYSRIISGKPVLTEHIQAKWLEANELHSLEWAPADIPAIDKLAKVMNF
ncbi:MAG TPA: (deoxy)nucleoside triphosphate pyrophosphohydrolase [Pseudogracilibacillus sp.]|nr:(deoxy)nucleoside triphosphate pyrophosphohydrolase [Pseudogracilibacillus sp.]